MPTSKEHACELIKAGIARSKKASPSQIKTIKNLNSKVTDEFIENLTMKQASAMLTALLATAKRKKEDEEHKKNGGKDK